MNFLVYCSDSYRTRSYVLLESLEKHHPKCLIDVIHVPINTDGYIPGMAKERLKEAYKICKNRGDVVIIGADCEIFAPMTELESLIENGKNVIVPHTISPLDNRDYMAQLYCTGHANADLMAFTDPYILEWLIDVTDGNEPDKGIFYEQTWLSSIPFLFDNVTILRHAGYNWGYWRGNDCNIQIKDNIWTVDTVPLVMTQYSGFEKGSPQRMSKHYSGPDVTGDVLKLFQNYDRRI